MALIVHSARSFAVLYDYVVSRYLGQPPLIAMEKIRHWRDNSFFKLKIEVVASLVYSSVNYGQDFFEVSIVGFLRGNFGDKGKIHMGEIKMRQFFSDIDGVCIFLNDESIHTATLLTISERFSGADRRQFNLPIGMLFKKVATALFALKPKLRKDEKARQKLLTDALVHD